MFGGSPAVRCQVLSATLRDDLGFIRNISASICLDPWLLYFFFLHVDFTCLFCIRYKFFRLFKGLKEIFFYLTCF